MINEFLNYISITKAENTAVTYSQAMADMFPRGYVEPTREFVLDYIKTKKDQGRTISTIKSRLACLVSFMKYNRNVNYDVVEIFNSLKKVHKQQPIPTMEDVQKFLEYAPSNKDRLMLIFASLFGMRVSEISNINMDDVVGNRIYIRDTKNNHDRYVFFGDYVQLELQAYLTERFDTSNALFTTIHGRQTTKATQAMVSKLNDSLDMQYSPHAFRRFCCTELKKNGADNTVIDRIIGHSEGCTGSYYIGNIDTLMVGALRKLEKVLLCPLNMH